MTHKNGKLFSLPLPLQTRGKARAIINRNNFPFMWSILYEGNLCTLQNNSNEVSNSLLYKMKGILI